MRKIAVPDEGVETLFGAVRRKPSPSRIALQCPDPHRRPRAASSKASRTTSTRWSASSTRSARSCVRATSSRKGEVKQRPHSWPRTQVSSFAIISSKARSVRRRSGRSSRRASISARYLEAIDKHDIVFGVGPAGTGKTYLAMAQAVSFLLSKRVSRIILARPAVEAGEKLGFLPGDLAGEGEPLSAAALRRALRHARRRARRAAARARHDRDRAHRVHARAHAERRVRHPGRGAEHDVRADEDVPDPPRLRLEGGDHRRHHPDRSADGRASRVSSKRSTSSATIEGIAFIHFDDRDVVRHKLVQQIVQAYAEFTGGGSDPRRHPPRLIGARVLFRDRCHREKKTPVPYSSRPY